uniref:hypothetical protein n=1 Tax=unclassified Streptomyces TaxID=2593676 RepID=UPI00131A20FA
RGGNSGYTYKSGKWVWHFTPKSWFDPRYQAYRANPSTYKVFHYNAKAAAAARAKAEAAARARAQAERRRRDGVLVSILKGDFGAGTEKINGMSQAVARFESRIAGETYEALALVAGAKCEENKGLTVCRTAQPMYGRGGTNVGGTYVTRKEKEYVSPKRLQHERVHTKQWNENGFFYIPQYFGILGQGLNPCHNSYEIEADLKKGGYKC